MKLRVMSDLHLDFLLDSKGWLESLEDVDCDVIVVAGDLSNFRDLGECVSELCNRFKDKPIVFLPGNHEYYGALRRDVISLMKYKQSQHENLDYVDLGESKPYGGRTFTCMTLWFRQVGFMLESQFSDFFYIKGLRNWVYEENKKSIDYLESNLNESSIVFSHHLPSYKSIAPKFINDPGNVFFLCDLTMLIQNRQPQLWVHGHTHTACDYSIGKTRIICNPRGYGKEETGFNPNLIIDV